jgi:thymidylate synthase ThyX
MRLYLFDEFEPETSAMLQALYSRSPRSVLEHVQKVRKEGPDRFMASYYVGYGHASIGDCGVTTLYLEDVSLLACKAVQDSQLYSGQETSTRYIDFSKQRVHDPIGSQRSAAYQQRWINYYMELYSSLIGEIEERFPNTDGNRKTWEKAVSARALDIARAFLPAGVTSQLSWTTTIRHAHEHIIKLEAHPLPEVRTIAAEARLALSKRYSNSFGHSLDQAQTDYQARVGEMETYFAPPQSVSSVEFEVKTDVDNAQLEREALALIADRPRRAQLPKSLARYGRYVCKFQMDFGSFRDLQRHRRGICRMPLLTTKLGFNGWYLNQMSARRRAAAETFIAAQTKEFVELASSRSVAEQQYYIPIGMNVACELIYDLPEMVYVSELRSGRTVHPTLRSVAQSMARFLLARHPRLALYADLSESAFSVKRGTQDIVSRVA